LRDEGGSMCKEKIVLLGGGGHCASVIDSILEKDIYSEIVVLDNDNSLFLPGGIHVIGNDEELPLLYQEGFHHAFITVGSIGDCSVRKKLFQKIEDIGFFIPNIIDKSATVSKWSNLGRGIYVGKMAVINSKVEIDNCAIINTGAILEHDCKIGEFVHVSTGAKLCGGVEVGCETHVGAGTVIKEYTKVGAHCLIGAGSVVIKSVDNHFMQYGCPAHKSSYKIQTKIEDRNEI
jgi:sugar O-acyltransferase (sialic acid O-acetyltransferase NeuD family)